MAQESSGERKLREARERFEASYFTVEQAAEQLGISVEEAGKLPQAVAQEGAQMVPAWEIERYQREHP